MPDIITSVEFGEFGDTYINYGKRFSGIRYPDDRIEKAILMACGERDSKKPF